MSEKQEGHQVTAATYSLVVYHFNTEQEPSLCFAAITSSSLLEITPHVEDSDTATICKALRCFSKELRTSLVYFNLINVALSLKVESVIQI